MPECGPKKVKRAIMQELGSIWNQSAHKNEDTGTIYPCTDVPIVDKPLVRGRTFTTLWSYGPQPCAQSSLLLMQFNIFGDHLNRSENDPVCVN